jgi:hypothetical protein
MKLRLREIRISRHEVCWDILLYTDRGVIPARNAIYAHTQDFVGVRRVAISHPECIRTEHPLTARSSGSSML